MVTYGAMFTISSRYNNNHNFQIYGHQKFKTGVIRCVLPSDTPTDTRMLALNGEGWHHVSVYTLVSTLSMIRRTKSLSRRSSPSVGAVVGVGVGVVVSVGVNVGVVVSVGVGVGVGVVDRDAGELSAVGTILICALAGLTVMSSRTPPSLAESGRLRAQS